MLNRTTGIGCHKAGAKGREFIRQWPAGRSGRPVSGRKQDYMVIVFGPGYRCEQVFRNLSVKSKINSTGRGGRISDAPGFCVATDTPMSLESAERRAIRLIRKHQIVPWGPFGAIPIEATSAVPSYKHRVTNRIGESDPRIFMPAEDLIGMTDPMAETITIVMDYRGNSHRQPERLSELSPLSPTDRTARTVIADVTTRGLFPGETEGFLFFGIAPTCKQWSDADEAPLCDEALL